MLFVLLLFICNKRKTEVINKLVRALTKAEKMILKEMYPAGCRVKLEEITSDPESKLKPGDLGTVLDLDDDGGLHIAWDQGGWQLGSDLW